LDAVDLSSNVISFQIVQFSHQSKLQFYMPNEGFRISRCEVMVTDDNRRNVVGGISLPGHINDIFEAQKYNLCSN
jgi:hypothetical protein